MVQQQSLLISNAVILLLCMIAGALSASLGSQVYSEAVPNRDYTLQNMSRADEVFASQTRSKRTPCTCERTEGVYGGTVGTAFDDIPNNPCDEVLQITDIYVRYGTVVDALQLSYATPQRFVNAPLRGGTGGGLTHIPVPVGAKVVGITGGIGDLPQYGKLISQLRILVLDVFGQLQIYGPFGTDLYSFPGSFAVYGDIKSIFGYHRQYLDGLGVNYRPLGEGCPGLCPNYA